MPEASTDMMLAILRACQPVGQSPLYPSQYVKETGIDRALLDQGLDQLRLAGLIRLTDWQAGLGQGYALTEDGMEARQQGQDLKRWLHRPKSVPAAAQKVQQTPWEKGEMVREALSKPTPPLATMILLLLNILVFVAGMGLALTQEISLDAYLSGRQGQNRTGRLDQVHEQLGALLPYQVLVQKQWWRILSHGFVHGGFIHLFMNMFALFFLGPIVEKMWGTWRFVLLYFISIWTGGCAVLIASQAAVGASGAISGILVSLLAWVMLNRQSLPREWVNRVMTAMLGNLAMLVYLSFLPGISWSAHLGGALGGLLASLPMNALRYSTGWRKVAGGLGVALVPLASLGLVVVVHWNPVFRPEIVAKEERLANLQLLFRQAERKTVKAYGSDLKPLLDAIWKKNVFAGKPDQLAQTFPRSADVFVKVEDFLKPVVVEFQEAGPLPTEENTAAARQATEYLKAWGDLFSWANAYCEQPLFENWDALIKHHHYLLEMIPAQHQDATFPTPLHLSTQSDKKKK